MTVLTIFRHRLKVQEPQLTFDDTGGQVETWVDVAEVWGEVRGLNGRERLYADAFEGELTHKLTLRQPVALTAKSRLLCEDVPYDVVAFYDPDGQDRVLVCECISRGR